MTAEKSVPKTPKSTPPQQKNSRPAKHTTPRAAAPKPTAGKEARFFKSGKKYISSINPATLETFDKTDLTDLSQIATMFAQAKKAQKIWAETPYSQRRAKIKRMEIYIARHADELAEIISRDNGKTKTDALVTEVLPCTLAANWYAKNTAKYMRPRMLPGSTILFFNKRNVLIRQPMGIIGIISPWNYPLTIPFGELIMALMTGNAVMLKVAPDTVATGKAIEQIVAAADLPAGLFHHHIGPGADILDAWLENGIHKIFFTGSVRTGKAIMARAAHYLTPVSLELGGKDPMIVLPDADLEKATNGAAWAGYQNSGQTCAGVERIYVHSSIFEPFVELLRRKTLALRHGADQEFSSDLGAMTNSEQLQEVQRQVKDAVSKGARILAQSSPTENTKGYFFPATLMTGVDHSMDIMRLETFGPVLPVMPYDTIEEAVALANDSEMGLTASLWTKNISLGKKIAEELQAGVVTINDHLYTHGQSETPWGGWKQSGIGRTHAAQGIEEMTQPKLINWDILPVKRNLWWYPLDEKAYRAIQAIFGFLYPVSLGNFLGSGLKMSSYLIKKIFSPWKL